MRYPADIVTNKGWERIHEGHGLDRAVLVRDLAGRHGDLREGEWHAHWTQARTGAGDPFTIVRRDRRMAECP